MSLRSPRLVLTGAGKSFAIVLIALSFPTLVSTQAQNRPDLEQADAQLNQIYQQLLASLPSHQREQLRVAQRAWVAFVDKSELSVATTAPTRPGQGRLAQTRARTTQLRQMFTRNAPANSAALAASLRAADVELNTVYQQCLGTMSAAEANPMREAQRTWIIFRDANRVGGPGVILTITNDRTRELQEYYLGRATSNVASSQPVATSQASPARSLDPSIPDPFERAR
jgi:uncharacterized protein YecT (DUF1311 family)